MHYARVRATGDPGPADRYLQPANLGCVEPGCERQAKARGRCALHARRARRAQDLAAGLAQRVPSWATPAERLKYAGWDTVERVPGLGPCWEWRGSRDRRGYGRVSMPGRVMRAAHRVAYAEWVGPIPAGMMLCHACDNPPCINPAHLSPGTQHDNMGAAAARDRVAYGERQGGHKLTAAQVLEVRAKYVPRVYTQARLAAEYGVSQKQIHNIVRGRQWVRLDDEADA